MQSISRANYLCTDANHPLITAGSFKTEIRLYNLDSAAVQNVNKHFMNICGKDIKVTDQITSLSGGEKVILMALLTLNCPAPKVRFLNLWHALDPEKRSCLKQLIDSSAKDIIMEDSEC